MSSDGRVHPRASPNGTAGLLPSPALRERDHHRHDAADDLGAWPLSARCAALSVASDNKKYVDGTCVLTNSDGHQIYSTFGRATSTNCSRKWIAGTMRIAAQRRVNGILERTT
jgi:hypothetical protein